MTIRDEILKGRVRDVLGLDVFSEEVMDAELEQITVDGSMVSFHYKSGEVESREYIRPKKKGTKHTTPKNVSLTVQKPISTIP